MKILMKMKILDKKENPLKVEKKKGQKLGKKRKRPVPLAQCKCVETVKCLTSMLRDCHELCKVTLANFPELSGKILELTQKAINNEIFHPLKILKKQLVDKEKRDVTRRELEKSRRCKATLHDPEDVLPDINGYTIVCHASDEENWR